MGRKIVVSTTGYDPTQERTAMIHLVEQIPDIADRLVAAASADRSYNTRDLGCEAATLIRDLDRAISHMIAVKGSAGLSPWAMSVLHEAIARQQRRGDA